MINLRNLFLAAASLFVSAAVFAQTYEYPFQNPDLPDEDPNWDNSNWLAKKQPEQKRLGI